jgi:hypothetical protein
LSDAQGLQDSTPMNKDTVMPHRCLRGLIRSGIAVAIAPERGGDMQGLTA